MNPCKKSVKQSKHHFEINGKYLDVLELPLHELKSNKQVMKESESATSDKE